MKSSSPSSHSARSHARRFIVSSHCARHSRCSTECVFFVSAWLSSNEHSQSSTAQTLLVNEITATRKANCVHLWRIHFVMLWLYVSLKTLCGLVLTLYLIHHI